jgi:flagellar protein FliS
MSVAYARAMQDYGRSGPLAAANEQSPQQLVACLLDGALTRIAAARRALADGDAAARGQASTRIIEILGYLDGVLDMQAGGEIAERLRSLYAYCVRRIFAANRSADDGAYAEVAALVGAIKSAWDALPMQAGAVA